MKKTTKKTGTRRKPALPEATKPGYPKAGIMLDVSGDGLPVRLDMDIERFSSGSMRMRVGGAADVFESEGGKKLGGVASTIGGGIAVTIGKRDFYIPVETLWEIGKRADAEYQRRLDAGEV